MKRKRMLRIVLTVILFAAVTLIAYNYHLFHIMWYDYPDELSQTETSIDVYYINWACECADFAVKEQEEPTEETSIFIEASDPKLIIPESYYNSGHFDAYLRLTGSFYEDEGISRSYEMKMPGEKPKAARVFRYTSYQFIPKERENQSNQDDTR